MLLAIWWRFQLGQVLPNKTLAFSEEAAGVRCGGSALRLSDGEHGIQSKMKNVVMYVWAPHMSSLIAHGAQGMFELLVASQVLQAQLAVDFSRTGRVWKSLQGLALAARSRPKFVKFQAQSIQCVRTSYMPIYEGVAEIDGP